MQLLRALTLVAVSVALTPGASAQPTEAQGDKAVDTVTLMNGRAIMAPIIKETPQTIWLDLGSEVLAIPRAEVQSVLRAAPDAADADTDERDLFSTASNLAERSPKEHAKIIGEAVIKVSTPSGLGSGFIIHSDGHAITNAHVIQGETRIKATVFEQADRDFKRINIDDVEIVAVNNHLDLALIKLNHPEGKPFKTVYIQGSERLEVGEEVFAIGNPLGLERTLSAGVVSTTQRSFEGMSFVQTTAEINPGNSGGPLFNSKGEVVGVINMGATFADGIGFGIPTRYLRDFLRNREAFAYDKENPNSGYSYNAPPPRLEFDVPAVLDDDSGT
jgi:serine protease Do